MHLLWSYHSPAAIRGLRLAREPGTLLVWDSTNTLTWLSPAGTRGACWEATAPIAAVDCADDGSAVAVAGTQGQMWIFAADWKLRWQRSLPNNALAIAIAPFGEMVALGDGGGVIHFLDRAGHDIARAANPRPLLHLTFVPERTQLIGSADFGFIAAFTLEGKRLWHDTPVAYCGALASTGDGRLVALASFSEGLSLYDLRGKKAANAPQTGPCRLVALAYDGSAILTAGLDDCVRLHDRQVKTRSEYRPESTVTTLALDALGRTAFLGLANGTVLALRTD